MWLARMSTDLSVLQIIADIHCTPQPAESPRWLTKVALDSVCWVTAVLRLAVSRYCEA